MLALAAALLLTSGSPFNVNWATDGLLTGAMATVYFLGEQAVKPGIAGTRACRIITEEICDRKQLLKIDQSVVDNHSRNWAVASDVFLYSTFALTLGATAIDVANDSGDRIGSWGKDSIVLVETFFATQLTTNLFKYSMRRARPSQYRASTDITIAEEQLSFPSGHTAGVASAATAYTYAFVKRHPGNSANYLVGSIGAVLTILTGYARAQAGRHFYTDVIAGAALGVAIGYLVPSLHSVNGNPRSENATMTASERPRAPMLGWGTQF
ncbi:MAG: phosphatase PAP2 family protein [Clostridia bacterium]|nr:phosphatase PAP2 family protein [Deltaproteobacteria bacterium]